jgi:hypothetical protein
MLNADSENIHAESRAMVKRHEVLRRHRMSMPSRRAFSPEHSGRHFKTR